MKAFRRGIWVAVIAALAGFAIRFRGKDGVPPANGGWRELESPTFR